MFFKLIALGLVAANPTPLAAKVADEAWREVGISDITALDINCAIVALWPGLTINDFKWVEDEWWQHGDQAYEIDLKYEFTTFYERWY